MSLISSRLKMIKQQLHNKRLYDQKFGNPPSSDTTAPSAGDTTNTNTNTTDTTNTTATITQNTLNPTDIKPINAVNTGVPAQNEIDNEFLSIMDLYLQDANLVNALSIALTPEERQEFVLYYPTIYASKLAKLTNQKMSLDRFIALFKDMLKKSLTEKGIIPNLPAGAPPLLPTLTTPAPTPAPTPSPSPFPTPSKPSPTPAKPTSAFGQLEDTSLGDLTTVPYDQQIENLYDPVRKNAIEYLRRAIYKKFSQTQIDHFLNYYNDLPDDFVMTKKNKLQSSYKLALKLVSLLGTGESVSNMEVASFRGVLNNLKIDLPPESVVLPMGKPLWIADRQGMPPDEFKGYGIEGNKECKLKNYHHVIGKYYVDKKKLGTGILDIRYVKNRHVGTVKPQHISPEMNDIVQDMLNHKKIDKGKYNKLKNNTEKHLCRHLNEMFDLGEDLGDLDDENFNERFNIVIGEIRAGNTNTQLKHEARKYIMYAMKMNKIHRNVAYDLITELGL